MQYFHPVDVSSSTQGNHANRGTQKPRPHHTGRKGVATSTVVQDSTLPMGRFGHTLQQGSPTNLNVRLCKRVIGNNDDTERLPPQRTVNHMLHHNKWVPKICSQETGTVVRHDINTRKGHQSHLREGKRMESKMVRYRVPEGGRFTAVGKHDFWKRPCRDVQGTEPSSIPLH